MSQPGHQRSQFSPLNETGVTLLFVPFVHTSTSQARAFSAIGTSVWNRRRVSKTLTANFKSSKPRAKV